MSDIIDDTERAYKAMQKLWGEKVAESCPKIPPMRYQRFKVLRSVQGGLRFVPDISRDSGINIATTAELLHGLKSDRLVTRERVNSRSYGWDITKKGDETATALSEVLDSIMEPLREIAKERMETWI